MEPREGSEGEAGKEMEMETGGEDEAMRLSAPRFLLNASFMKIMAKKCFKSTPTRIRKSANQN